MHIYIDQGYGTASQQAQSTPVISQGQFLCEVYGRPGNSDRCCSCGNLPKAYQGTKLILDTILFDFLFRRGAMLGSLTLAWHFSFTMLSL